MNDALAAAPYSLVRDLEKFVERDADGNVVAVQGNTKLKLTPETAATIINSIERHGSNTIATAAAGVHQLAISEWLRKGRAGEGPAYEIFAREYDAALARWEKGHIDNVDDAAFGRGKYKKKGPNAQMSWNRLRSRLPGEYGDAVRHELTGEGGGPIEFRLTVETEPPGELSAQDRERMEQALTERARIKESAEDAIDAEYELLNGDGRA